MSRDHAPRRRPFVVVLVVPESRQRRIRVGRDEGRRHLAADLRPLPNDPASPVAASEFVTTSVSSRGGSLESMQHMRRHNPDVAHARGDERGWALIEVTPEATQCEFRATAHPALADAVFAAQARFAVEAGRPGVQAA